MKAILQHKNGGFDCYFKTAVPPLAFCFGAWWFCRHTTVFLLTAGRHEHRLAIFRRKMSGFRMFFGFRECETRRNPKASWGQMRLPPTSCNRHKLFWGVEINKNSSSTYANGGACRPVQVPFWWTAIYQNRITAANRTAHQDRRSGIVLMVSVILSVKFYGETDLAWKKGETLEQILLKIRCSY